MSSSTALFLRPRLRPQSPPPSSFLSSLAVFLLAAAVHIPHANAFSWDFQSAPQQCQNLVINVTGNDGQPPYRVLIIPFGPSPLANNVEARRITEQVFPDTQRSASFQLRYPANSQLVAVVSDASGFGSGGTSVAAQVGSSSDSGCFDSTQNVSPDFVFSIEPANQVVQCQPMRIWWDPNQVRGTPNFLGVIPGGQSFAIPRGAITRVDNQGMGFSWTPNVRGGTTLMLVGGDDRGNGTAGSVLFVVGSGINNDSGCLNGTSPSSTPGSPAGGSYPTGVNGGTSGGGGGNNNSGGGSNTGAIVGGVIGGLVFLVAIILLLFFLRRRSRVQKRAKERPVDLLNEDEDEEDGDHHQNPNARPPQQLQYYTPEPFMVPDPTLASDTDGYSQTAGTSTNRPLSGGSQTYSRSGTPDLLGGSQHGYGWAAAGSATSASRKGQPIRMRPVNIVQHEDAGPPPGADKDEEPETIELPPAYTAVNASAVNAAGTLAPGVTAGGGNANATPRQAATETVTAAS